MAKVQNFSEISPDLPFTEYNFYDLYRQGRVNQRVQHYEIFLKKTSAGVKKLSFSLGLALIFLYV